MRPVESIGEIGEAVDQARTDAAEYCSNFFPVAQKLQGWITHGELFCDCHDDVALFLRRDRGFWHLYFCAAHPMALQRAVATTPILVTDPVVLDLIGKEPALGRMASWFEAAGFRSYSRLVRMTRTVTAATPALEGVPDSRVAIANQTDCQPILDLLLQSFDCRAEQIPMLYEIAAAVAAGQIRVARGGNNKLAGLLFFETQGMSSLLRYWLIAPEFRAQQFGSGLMRRYLTEHPTVRRFLLWVVASNHDAIGKYEHYGFAPEGLVDYVLANDKIRR
jgi:Acetyltransferase (GNAT) family